MYICCVLCVCIYIYIYVGGSGQDGPPPHGMGGGSGGYGFLWFPLVFLWFPMVSYGLLWFPMVFIWFPMVSSSSEPKPTGGSGGTLATPNPQGGRGGDPWGGGGSTMGACGSIWEHRREFQSSFWQTVAAKSLVLTGTLGVLRSIGSIDKEPKAYFRMQLHRNQWF